MTNVKNHKGTLIELEKINATIDANFKCLC